MTWMNGNSHARVDVDHPETFAACDRCSWVYNLVDLKWQMQWRGTSLQRTGFLVCSTCLDIPNEQLRTIIIPPDPLPVLNARPPQWQAEQGPPPPVEPVVDVLFPDNSEST